MAVIDKKFIKALTNGTKVKKIEWHGVDKKFYKGYFSEVEEDVQKAYYFKKDQNNIIVYKSTTYMTDAFGNDVERSNVHIVIGKNDSLKSDFKLSDYDLPDDADLWTLYKLIQRHESKVDSIMEDIIKDFGKLEF
jgi:hypothetical protein